MARKQTTNFVNGWMLVKRWRGGGGGELTPENVAAAQEDARMAWMSRRTRRKKRDVSNTHIIMHHTYHIMSFTT